MRERSINREGIAPEAAVKLAERTRSSIMANQSTPAMAEIEVYQVTEKYWERSTVLAVTKDEVAEVDDGPWPRLCQPNRCDREYGVGRLSRRLE
jgi:hypothetical protein